MSQDNESLLNYPKRKNVSYALKAHELEIEIEGFSGPLDLLCSLVESRQFRASNIKITKLVKIYGLYLAKTRQVPINTLAEFFYMAAGLLLEKTRSLLPGINDGEELYEYETEGLPENLSKSEEELIKTLERYRPYRAAYLWLAKRFADESKSFRREGSCESQKDHSVPEYNNIEDGVYLLARTWSELYRKHESCLRKIQAENEAADSADWDGFAGSEHDQKQIQTRIAELENQLADSKSLSLSSVCSSAGLSRHLLVITILALLEMCRLGTAYIEQDELFSDVKIFSSSRTA